MLKSSNQTPTMGGSRMQLYSQAGKRRSSLEDFLPNTTSNAKFSEFTQNQKNKKYNAKNTNTLPLSELINIKERTLIGHNPEASRRQQDREELRDLSSKRVQKWPNTLQAIRKKRDQWRFEKFEREEKQRRLIDAEEKKYQEQVKKQILDKANKQIYLDQDRIRSFQSKMLLSDALQEREQQIAQKQTLKEIDKLRNEIYEEEMKEIIRLEQEEDARKLAELQEKKRHNAKVLRQQHDEMKTNYIKKLQEEKIEGEIAKLHAMDAIEKEKMIEINRIQKQKDLNKEVAEGNKVLKLIKEKERQKEIEEENKIKAYAEKKERMETMKRIRSEQRFKEKQAELTKLQDIQYQKLLDLKKDEDARINKQIVEAEIKAENVEKQKREYRENLIKRIDSSVKMALNRKEQEQARLKEEDEKFKQFFIQKNKEIAEREQKEKQETYERNRNLQDYHKEQIEKKQKEREKLFLNEIDEQEKIQQLMEQDDKNYDEWSKRVLGEWQKDEKNTFPLLKELENDKKKRFL